MIKIENVVTPSLAQWEAVIRGMRNPLNSWEKSDSDIGCDIGFCKHCAFKRDWCGSSNKFIIGPNDLDLMTRLRNAGNEHRKFMRMLPVMIDITAPLYWWKEFETYRIGVYPNPSEVEMNSCSTMHKVHAKEFTMEDFSCEHLITRESDYWDWDIAAGPEAVSAPLDIFSIVVDALNTYREQYLKTKDKNYWWQMIQLLPSSYNQTRTLSLNYEVLLNMYHQRKNHKLDEWREFCSWIETLPYSELITGEKKEN